MLTKRDLGRTGFKVTEISFGAWAIGGKHYGVVPEKQASACIEAFIAQGGNFIDTARRYGASECLLGDHFRRNGGREDVYVATKSHQVNAAAIKEDLEGSLRALYSDYVDLYYLHSPPDDSAEMNRVLDVYDELKAENKIRAIGASIKGPNVTQETVDLCLQYIRSGRVDVLMVIYSVFRQKNAEMFQEALESGVGVVARTVLESGFLAGTYAPGYEFRVGDHRARWHGSRLKNILKNAQELKASVVVPPYETLGQVAIRFALDTPGVSSVALGGKTPVQIEENGKAASLPPLGSELRKYLTATYRERGAEFNTGE